jgi:uncharacterized membrane protein YdjX (TVP38/TMEM64 family)
MDVDTGGPKEPSKRLAKLMIALSVLFIVVIAALAVVFREQLINFHQYGYLGAFIISAMAGATIIVYVPGVPIVFTLGGLLPFPFLVGIAAGLGEALGEFTGYGAGRGGHAFLSEKYKHNKHYERVQGWMTRRGYLTLFLASAIFNPVFDIIGATAGAMRFPPWKFYLVCAAGKAVKGTYVAYLGSLGLGYILQWFGIKLPA